MTLPTASHIYRAENCPPSCALPQVQTTNQDAQAGTSGHRYLQRVPAVGAALALAEVPEKYRPMCERIELDGLPLEDGAASPGTQYEVAFAFDVATGAARLLGVGLERQYGTIAPTEIAGTLDVIRNPVAEGEIPEVLDYKFDGYESHSPAPDVNPQLLFGGLCLQRLYGYSNVRLTLIHFRPDGSHWAESSTRDMDGFDFDCYALRLRELVDRVHMAEDGVYAKKTPDVRRGPWCRYCPAIVHCPAVVAMVAAAASNPGATVEEIRLAMNEQGGLEVRRAAASKAYLRLKQIEDALKPWKTALYMFASEHSIDLGDGKVYGQVDIPKETVDGKLARQVLATLHGGPVAEAACSFDTSKAAIERALRPVWEAQKKVWEERKAVGEKGEDGKALKKPTITAIKKHVLDEIKKVNGVESKISKQVRTHRVSATGEIALEGTSGSDEDPVPF
jgi:hypothetical protein